MRSALLFLATLLSDLASWLERHASPLAVAIRTAAADCTARHLRERDEALRFLGYDPAAANLVTVVQAQRTSLHDARDAAARLLRERDEALHILGFTDEAVLADAARTIRSERDGAVLSLKALRSAPGPYPAPTGPARCPVKSAAYHLRCQREAGHDGEHQHGCTSWQTWPEVHADQQRAAATEGGAHA